MVSLSETVVFRDGEIQDRNMQGLYPESSKLSLVVPHEGDLEFTLTHFGHIMPKVDEETLYRLSMIEADNGALHAGQEIAAQLSRALMCEVTLVRFLVDRIFLDGNRWQLVNPDEPNNRALRPLLSAEEEAEAVRQVGADFAQWNQLLQKLSRESVLSIHPHSYTPFGTDCVLNGVGSIQAYIDSHVEPQGRAMRPAVSAVTHCGMQGPRSPMGHYIAEAYRQLGAEQFRVGYPYGGELPDCVVQEVLENRSGFAFEGNQWHMAKNPKQLLKAPWEAEMDPEKIQKLCVAPSVAAALNYLGQETRLASK